FDQPDRREEQHPDSAEHHERSKHPGGIELCAVLRHQIAEAGAGSNPLADRGPDHGERRGDLEAGKDVGSAAGKRSLRKICASLALSERKKFMNSVLTDCRPVTKLTVSGKNATSAVMMMRGSALYPNQITRIGAMAMTGIVCEATINGSTPRRNAGR